MSIASFAYLNLFFQKMCNTTKCLIMYTITVCIAIMIGQKGKKCHHISQSTLSKLQPIDPMVILSYLKTTMFPCAKPFFSACKGGTSTGFDMLAQRAYEPGLMEALF